jgi:hypothetical protein
VVCTMAPVLALVACTFTQDLTALDNGVCPAGNKACNDKCVSTTDPANGCGLETCAPCTLSNATAVCAPNGTCAVAACNPGYKECAGDIGCSTHTGFDPENCGNCGNACQVPNALPGCTNGECVVSSCNPGYNDCDNLPANGCECHGACSDAGGTCLAVDGG